MHRRVVYVKFRRISVSTVHWESWNIPPVDKEGGCISHLPHCSDKIT